MNWLTNILRDSDAKHRLVDDLECFVILVCFGVFIFWALGEFA